MRNAMSARACRHRCKRIPVIGPSLCRHIPPEPEVCLWERDLVVAVTCRHLATVPERFRIRRFCPEDSVPSITRLLHEAYAPLAAMGFRYTATWQDDDITLRRLTRGVAFVAEHGGAIVATVTLYPDAGPAAHCEWYATPGVHTFGQFAVRPDFQKQGLGRRLIQLVEAEARERGATELALDTAEGAAHLRACYDRLGYRFIQFMTWSDTNYRSVILSKSLCGNKSDAGLSR